MTLNYKILEDNGTFNIFETQTEQVIKSVNTNEEARKLLRHFNMGGGFDGCTPNFFLQKFKISYH